MHFHIVVKSDKIDIREEIITDKDDAIELIKMDINRLEEATGTDIVDNTDNTATFGDGSTISWKACNLDHSQESQRL